MGSLSVEQVLWRALTDPVFRAHLVDDRCNALSVSELSAGQLEALERIDAEALSAMGGETDQTVPPPPAGVAPSG